MKEYAGNWKLLNPEYEIELYDDEMCETFLLEEFGELHREIFRYIPDGPIKADFWRVCILYKYGGIYCDIDNQPLMSLEHVIEEDVDFITCSSYWWDRFKFNPNFIISAKKNQILEKCIDWYIQKYTQQEPYGFWEWSVMKAFTEIIQLDDYNCEEGIYYMDGMKIQILRENPGMNHYDAHVVYKNNRFFNNRYPSWDCGTHSFTQ